MLSITNVAVAAATLALGSAAVAGDPLLDISFTGIGAGGGEVFEDMAAVSNPEPFIFNYGGDGSGFDYFNDEGDLAFQVGEWEVTYDTDPVVNLNFSITNTQAVADTFVVTANLPLLQSLTGGTLIGGNIGGFALDGGGVSGDGVQISANPLFQGMVDGADVLDLGTDNFNYSLPAGMGVGVLPNFNQPTTLAGPATANTSIGIRIEFTLSAGDTIQISSAFEILPVPAPAALALFGLAGIAGGRRRRD